MSFISSFLGGGGGSAAKYASTQSGLVRQNTALVGGLTDAYNSAARSGAWDPNSQLASLKADTAYQNGIDLGNSAASARTLGYRPGDSAPIDSMNAINAKSRLDYADAANRIRTGAAQAGYQAASNLANESSNIYGQSAQINSPLIQYGEQQDARQGQAFSTLLGSVMPFLAAPATGGASVAATAAKSFNPYAVYGGSSSGGSLYGATAPSPNVPGIKLPFLAG